MADHYGGIPEIRAQFDGGSDMIPQSPPAGPVTPAPAPAPAPAPPPTAEPAPVQPFGPPPVSATPDPTPVAPDPTPAPVPATPDPAPATPAPSPAQQAEPALIPDAPVDDLIDVGMSVLQQGEILLTSLMRPWNAYQIGIALALWIAAHVLRQTLGPPIRTWMGTREGWPKWRMRILVVVHQRLRPIFFVVLLWLALLIMREVTWPSRSYLLSIIATLATAWLVVVFGTRLIRSKFLRRTVRYGAWAYVTLHILGLTEQAARLLDSAAFELGEIRLSLLVVVQAFVIIGVLIALARFFTKATSQRIQANEDISPSMRVLIVKGLQLAFYGIALYVGVQAVGLDLTGLAVLSGAIGVGLGFGLQKVVSNLVSGVIILLDKSIKPGDVISLGETFGWINTLGARYASVVTRDGKEYLIPNEDLITNQVVNWSHSDDFVRLDIYFGTAYGDDPHVVRKLAIEAAKSVDRVLGFKAPVCHIVGFGDSSVDYILRFWIRDPTQGLTNIRGNVYLALWDAFKENDISIPFPQREVKMMGGEMPERVRPEPPKRKKAEPKPDPSDD